MPRRRLLLRTGAASLGLVVAVAVVGGAVLLRDDPTPASSVSAASAASPAAATPANQLTPKPPTPRPLDTTAVVVAAPNGVQVYASPNGARKLRLGGRTDLGAEQTL